MFRSVV